MARTTEVLSFSLPPRVAKEMEDLAKRQRITKSQLLREMILVYESYLEEKRFEELQRYGRRKAREAGITTEEDIERIIHEARGV